METNGIHLDASKRHDAVLLFDVTDGNPNGDPDAGNLPSVDPETMQGLVTDVAVKRKIRNYVDELHGTEDAFKIYIQDKGIVLNELHERAYTALKVVSKGANQARGDVANAQAWMCENFFDVRAFGAVMSTKVNAGQVRGPVQLTFSRSIDQIVPLDLSITRVAITRKEDVQTVSAAGDEEGGKRTEMGRKALVPYGLYRGNIFVSPQQAKRTGFTSQDLALFWESLERAWDFDRSAARGLMSCRGIYIFSHENPFGNASASKLLEMIAVAKKDGVVAPRLFSDYRVTPPDQALLPEGVTLTILSA